MAIDLMQRDRSRATIMAGAGSGIVSGLVMALVAMLVSASAGHGFWFPPKLISGVLIGVNSIIGGPGSVMLGLIIHLAVSAFFGIVFGAVFGRVRDSRIAFTRGLVFGIGVYLFMNFLILPWANPTMNARVDLQPGWWFFEHLVYGGMLFMTPNMSQYLLNRETATSRTHVDKHRRAA